MTFLEALVWLGTVWAVWRLYCAIDAPTLTSRATHRIADRLWGDPR